MGDHRSGNPRWYEEGYATYVVSCHGLRMSDN